MSFARKELADLKPRLLERMHKIGSATAVAREFGINTHAGTTTLVDMATLSTLAVSP